MSSPVVHFEIIAKDPAGIRSFYSELFGWKMKQMEGPMDYATVDTGTSDGIHGGIGKAEQGDGYVLFYVSVDDPEATLNRIQELGGKTLVPVTEVPGVVTFAHFADPEGHALGIVKSSPVGAAASAEAGATSS